MCNKKIYIRLTEKEYTELKEKVNRSKLSQQRYLKSCFLSNPIRDYDFSEFKEVSKYLNEIYSILNKLLIEIGEKEKSSIMLISDSTKRIDDICHTLNEYLSSKI